MLKVGLTGSIGSGKSTMARYFQVLGIPVYIADVEAKKFLSDAEVTRLIVEMAGTDVLFADGSIDRRKLAAVVFNDPGKLAELNGIIHPRVRQHFYRWVDEQRDVPYIIQEAAVLFESGFYTMFDKIITVAAPEEERISRVMRRDGATREEVLARMDNQWPEEEKILKSDFVIINGDNDLAIPQVNEIHLKLVEISETFNHH